MKSISVIIPIYKGAKYLDGWVKKITRNFDLLQNEYDSNVELIFINDYPDQKIANISSDMDGIDIKVWNLPQNQGIHGARVAGISIAKGDFILMVDQDDEIEDNYLLSQISKIGISDGIVCNGYKKRAISDCKLIIYGSSKDILSVGVLDEYIKQGCRIVSPGQVLLRKEAIPTIWLKRIMQNSGADDLLLWLLMLGEGKEFAINEECLYTHVRHCNNTSSHSELMSNSEQEVVRILSENHALPVGKLLMLEKHYNEWNNMKYFEITLLYDRWMYLLIRGIRVSDYLVQNGFNKVIIYGLGYIGARLYDELKCGTVELIGGIDKSVVENVKCQAPMVTMESVYIDELIKKSDVIIVTVIGRYKEIKASIKKKYDIEVLAFDEVLSAMLEKTEKG